jgi:hypothetical protein
MTCEQQHNKDSGIRKFSTHNDIMDPIPPEKCHIAVPPALNEIEEMLVAQVYPYMMIYCLKNGRTAHQEGGCLNVEQEVTDLFDSLPSCPANIPVLPTSK